MLEKWVLSLIQPHKISLKGEVYIILIHILSHRGIYISCVGLEINDSS